MQKNVKDDGFKGKLRESSTHYVCLEKRVTSVISAEVKCVRSEDYYFFPSYAGEASAGILCFSFGHCIL